VLVLKTLIRRAFHTAGGLHAVRRRTRGQLRILMYHRFPQGLRGELEWQCSQIVRSYHPLSLKEAGQRMRAGEPIPPNAVVVTIDDGYRDFLEVAYPIFRSFQIPVTVFLTTGFLDGAWMWGDSVLYSLDHTRCQKIDLPVPSGNTISFVLESQEQRNSAAVRIKAVAKRLPDGERRRWIEDLPAALDVELPASPPRAYAALSWDEVRQISEHVDFGAHTKTHPILSRVESTECLREEILGSKRRIEQELQNTTKHFCYPNGLRGDIDERVLQVTREAGFEAAVMAEPGLNLPGTNLYQLRRIGVDPSHSRDPFLETVAGLRL
jgi:peptidoglycan/xylan/chitin deacetylase (PgdA/CDA1 family)